MPKKRTQDTQVNVRMTSAQKRRLEAATKTDLPGVNFPLGPWLLALGLREADTKLGPPQTKEERDQVRDMDAWARNKLRR